MGICYEKGLGVQRSLGEAVRCYQQSAALGNEPARERLQTLLSMEAAGAGAGAGQSPQGPSPSEKGVAIALGLLAISCPSGWVRAQLFESDKPVLTPVLSLNLGSMSSSLGFFTFDFEVLVVLDSPSSCKG